MDNNKETHLKDSKSIINKAEASIALKIAHNYLDLGVKVKDIGIISPYSDQVKLIQEKTEIEVKTVDGFQGREKEIIIISSIKSNKRELVLIQSIRTNEAGPLKALLRSLRHKTPSL